MCGSPGHLGDLREAKQPYCSHCSTWKRRRLKFRSPLRSIRGTRDEQLSCSRGILSIRGEEEQSRCPSCDVWHDRRLEQCVPLCLLLSSNQVRQSCLSESSGSKDRRQVRQLLTKLGQLGKYYHPCGSSKRQQPVKQRQSVTYNRERQFFCKQPGAVCF